MAGRLEDVTFHEKLGSLADKAVRLRALAGRLAERAQADKAALEEAAALAKADLVSQMVQEFPTLQGTMGGIYATAGGLPPAVARAIAEHYLPLRRWRRCRRPFRARCSPWPTRSTTSPAPGSPARDPPARATPTGCAAPRWVSCASRSSTD